MLHTENVAGITAKGEMLTEWLAKQFKQEHLIV